MRYFRFGEYGIEWKPYKFGDDVAYEYYFYFMPNKILEKKYRYFGYKSTWYDGPHYSFGFWWFNISWNFGLHVLKWK